MFFCFFYGCVFLINTKVYAKENDELINNELPISSEIIENEIMPLSASPDEVDEIWYNPSLPL